MNSLADGRTLLYFDLLGMQATIDDDIDVAAAELNYLQELLPSLTAKANWEFGSHFSDSVVLVHEDVEAALRESIRIWQTLFLFESDDWLQEGMECLPRGALVEGSVRIVPRVHWTKQGFRSTRRSVWLNWDKLLGKDRDYHEMQMIFRDQPEDVIVEKQRGADGKLTVLLYVRQLCPEELPFQITPHDPDGGLDSLEMAELGNITGPALSRAVTLSERQGIKGPRILVELKTPLPQAAEAYVVDVPNSSLRELLWTANFSKPSEPSASFGEPGHCGKQNVTYQSIAVSTTMPWLF